jgi:hypothetical protein
MRTVEPESPRATRRATGRNARNNTGRHELRGRYSTNRDSRGELDFTERALVKAEDYDQAAALFQWMAGRSGARLPGPPLAWARARACPGAGQHLVKEPTELDRNPGTGVRADPRRDHQRCRSTACT